MKSLILISFNNADILYFKLDKNYFIRVSTVDQFFLLSATIILE